MIEMGDFQEQFLLIRVKIRSATLTETEADPLFLSPFCYIG